MAIGDDALAAGYPLVPNNGEEGKVKWGAREINRTRDFVAQVKAAIASVWGIARGGTGATTAAQARTNLGLGSVATVNVVPLSMGGTGKNVASDQALITALGVGLTSLQEIMVMFEGGTGSSQVDYLMPFPWGPVNDATNVVTYAVLEMPTVPGGFTLTFARLSNGIRVRVTRSGTVTSPPVPRRVQVLMGIDWNGVTN